MKYVIINEQTLKDYNINNEHTLDAKELQVLSVHKDIISKFILHRAYSIQTEIWQWRWKKREEIGYETIKQLTQVAQDINNSGKIFDTYQDELKQKEEQENLKNK